MTLALPGSADSSPEDRVTSSLKCRFWNNSFPLYGTASMLCALNYSEIAPSYQETTAIHAHPAACCALSDTWLKRSKASRGICPDAPKPRWKHSDPLRSSSRGRHVSLGHEVTQQDRA